MKKILISLALLIVAVPAMAQWHGGYRYHGHPGYYSGGNWVAPLIIGGVVGAAIANRPVQTETVIVQPQPVILQQPIQNCSPWTETQNPDGTITRTRTCQQ